MSGFCMHRKLIIIIKKRLPLFSTMKYLGYYLHTRQGIKHSMQLIVYLKSSFGMTSSWQQRKVENFSMMLLHSGHFIVSGILPVVIGKSKRQQGRAMPLMMQNYVVGDHDVFYLADKQPIDIMDIGDVQIKMMNDSIWNLQNVRNVL